MKNSSVIISSIALIGVIVLFILQFTNTKKETVNTTLNSNSSFKVAYFEIDSLQNNYEYYKEVEKDLGLKEQKLRTELTAQRNAYVERAKEYQSKGQAMTQAEVAQAQQDLAQRERDIQTAEQTKAQDFQNEKFKQLSTIQKKIQDYLKEYNKTKGYSLIIANTPELIYYKDSTFNITNDLIKGLNEQYKKKN